MFSVLMKSNLSQALGMAECKFYKLHTSLLIINKNVIKLATT